MANDALYQVLRRFRRAAGPMGVRELDDSQLLERFVGLADGAAFEVLVWRHGGRVLDVCRRCLHSHPDVEDAFQATFLILVRRARSIRKGQSLGSWLYKVAYRVALRTRRAAARRLDQEAKVPARSAPEACRPQAAAELRPVLFEELDRLGEKYRLPIVLCYLQGLTTAEAAKQLGCAKGTVHSRLSSAREQLRARLGRRGITLPAAGLGTLLLAGAGAAAVPAGLVGSTLKIVALAVSGKALPQSAATSHVTALAEGVLQSMVMTKLRLGGIALLALCAVGLSGGQFILPALGDKPDSGPKASLVRGMTDTMELSKELPWIKVGQVKARGDAPPPGLRLVGTLSYDPDGLLSVRSRYAAEVTRIGQVKDNGKLRNLRYGDKVGRGDLLAVLWSRELAAAKTAYCDALGAVRLSEDLQKRYAELYRQGVLSLATLKSAERQFQVDTASALTAKRTLKMWKLSEDAIKEVREEGERLAQDRNRKLDKDKEEAWGRVEIRAPAAGTLVEKNVSVGDIVDPAALPLFKIADLSSLLVRAQPPEDVLELLTALPADKRTWTIRPSADPEAKPEPGSFQISPVLDPIRGTLFGRLDNKDGRLLVGQFVTITIAVSERRQELAVPASALVEEGGKAYVLVQPDADKLQYALRRVTVVRRDRDVVHLLTLLTPAQRQQGGRTLRPGDRVITAGAVELKALLEDLKSRK
jgi:cobalt-zinc-cadmium efflux system membrane fusion protein